MLPAAPKFVSFTLRPWGGVDTCPYGPRLADDPASLSTEISDPVCCFILPLKSGGPLLGLGKELSCDKTGMRGLLTGKNTTIVPKTAARGIPVASVGWSLDKW